MSDRDEPTIARLLLAELEREAMGTRRVLQRVPEGKDDWKPHRKSMPMGTLAALVATLPRWIESMVLHRELDLLAPGEYAQPTFANSRELMAGFEESVNAATAALADTTDAHLMTPWRLCYGVRLVSDMPRHIMIRDGGLNHWVHHRAQLTVYLRLNDRPVPSLYGPTADDPRY